jgi:hypothetical protein
MNGRNTHGSGSKPEENGQIPLHLTAEGYHHGTVHVLLN